jgi:hypothetical protein
MRTISANLEAILSTRSRSNHLKVEVDSTGSGDFINLCSYWSEKDWILSCSIDENEDQPTATARVEVKRSFEEIHMSPLVASSPVNVGSDMLYVNREIKISCATVGIDSVPQAADWALKFHGYIDEVDMGGTAIKLTCRDLGAKVMDAFIESAVEYGAALPGGRTVQLVMQDIIDATVVSPPTLYIPVNPGWVIGLLKQPMVPVFNAIRTLADQIGWIVRYRWDSGTSTYRLTLYGPDRAVSTTMRDFSPSEYFKINNAKISLKNVRTKVLVTYYTEPGGDPKTYPATSVAGLLAKYGTRFFGLCLNASDQINTLGEATTLGDRILADLEEPTMSHTVSMPLFWPAELGDYYGFTDNKVIYDSKQSLALLGVTHRFRSGGIATTTMRLRGKPASATTRWLLMEGRPGIARPPRNKIDAAGTGILTAPSAAGGIIFTYDNPGDMTPPMRDWATTKLYISTSPGFTPGPSNLYAQSRTTRFEINDLVPGTTYYVKIHLIDNAGNINTVSAQETIDAGYVGAMHLNKDNELGNIIVNSTLSNWSSPNTRAGNPPDNWVACELPPTPIASQKDSLWKSSGAPYAYFDTSTSNSAGVSIYMEVAATGNQVGIMTDKLVPMSGATIYKAVGVASVPNLSKYVRFYIMEYNAALTLIANTNYDFTPSAINTLERYEMIFRANSATRWCRVVALDMVFNVAGGSYVDRITMQRFSPSFMYEHAGTNLGSGLQQIYYSGATGAYDYGNIYSSPTCTIQEAGLYKFNASLVLQALVSGCQIQLFLYINRGAGAVAEVSSIIAENNSGGARDTTVSFSTENIDLAIGDTVDIRSNHNDTASRTVTSGPVSIFAGAMQPSAV